MHQQPTEIDINSENLTNDLALLNHTEISFIGKFDEKNANIIADFLRNNQKFTKLDFSQIDNSDYYVDPNAVSHFPKIAAELKNQLELKYLDLRQLLIDDETIRCLAPFFEHTKNLIMVDLSQNNLKDGSLVELMKAFEKNTSLQILNLNSNQISSGSTLELINFLEKHRNIQTVLLEKNHIGQEDLAAIQEELEKHKSSEMLNSGLYNNEKLVFLDHSQSSQQHAQDTRAHNSMS